MACGATGRSLTIEVFHDLVFETCRCLVMLFAEQSASFGP